MAVTVNLDPLRQVARDIQDKYPFVRTCVGIAERASPELAAKVRELDENLPDVVAGLVKGAEDNLRAEVRGAVGPMARSLGRFLDEALTAAGKRAPKRRRLKGRGKR